MSSTPSIKDNNNNIDYLKIWEDLDLTLKIDDDHIIYENKIIFTCDCDINNQDIIDNSNIIVCQNCGVVINDQVISKEAEWRSFNNEDGFNDNGNRCGQACDDLAPINSMATIIQGNSKLAKKHMWLSLPYKERVLYDLKNKINSILTLNNIPLYLSSTSLLLYKKFNNIHSSNDNHLFRKGNKDGVLAVCFYYAAKMNNLNITSTYICKIFKIDKKIFSKCCKIYNEFMNNKCDNKIFDVVDLIDRYTISLNLSFHIQKLCKNIIKVCTQQLTLLLNMSPQGIISGIIYFVSCEMNLNIKKNNIYSICDISENTMLKTYKVVKNNKNIIFNLIKNGKK